MWGYLEPVGHVLTFLVFSYLFILNIFSGDEANLALYCRDALERCLHTGGRVQGPSRLEAASVLTRDPTATKFPHSISVRLPNGDYQVLLCKSDIHGWSPKLDNFVAVKVVRIVAKQVKKLYPSNEFEPGSLRSWSRGNEFILSHRVVVSVLAWQARDPGSNPDEC